MTCTARARWRASGVGEWRRCILRVFNPIEELRLETHGPLGTIWVGLGLIAFYIALTWVNLLLGHFLTPLFIIPLTWVMDAWEARKADEEPDKTTVGA